MIYDAGCLILFYTTYADSTGIPFRLLVIK